MNTSHFPDLERCKKLTDVGFPETQMERIQNSFSKDWIWMTDKARNELFDKRCFDNLFSTADVKRHYRCPSVMEMLDAIEWRNIRLLKWEQNWVETQDTCLNWHAFIWTPPNALADMYIWLKENNYLPK